MITLFNVISVLGLYCFRGLKFWMVTRGNIMNYGVDTPVRTPVRTKEGISVCNPMTKAEVTFVGKVGRRNNTDTVEDSEEGSLDTFCGSNEPWPEQVPREMKLKRTIWNTILVFCIKPGIPTNYGYLDVLGDLLVSLIRAYLLRGSKRPRPSRHIIVPSVNSYCRSRVPVTVVVVHCALGGLGPFQGDTNLFFNDIDIVYSEPGACNHVSWIHQFSLPFLFFLF